MINKQNIIERLEAITKHIISSSILLKVNGKNKTCQYYDCTTEKKMKCTIKFGFLPSNIREVK
jgi:Zn-finger protein